MIVLLEPARPRGFISGGYRYQDEVMRRLAARGRGRQIAIRPAELETHVLQLRRSRAAGIVVDGLFFAATGAPLPPGTIALLHMVPKSEPWSSEPLHAIATSASTAASVRSVTRSVAIVRPGLDACFVPPKTRPHNEPLRVVCVGTVGPAKGQLWLAQTLAATAPAGTVLILVGDTTTHPDYVARIRATMPAGGLVTTGCLAAADVAGELQRADVFVSGSRDESFGMAVAEAVACGLPVVAFDAGEIPTFGPECAADEAAFTQQLQSLLTDSAARELARPTGRPALGTWDAVATDFEDAVVAAS